MDYKPFSLYNNFELNYKCFNRDCAIESTSYMELDIMKQCKNCNDKAQTYVMQTYYNKKHLGLDDWENYRGIEINKTCKNCNNNEKKSYSYSLITVGKTCSICGILSVLVYLRFINIIFKINLPIIKYGRFECEPCKNEWITYNIYWGCKHQCKKCFSLNYPCDISVEYYNPLYFKEYATPNVDNLEKNHISRLCEKCVVKGEACYVLSIEEKIKINKQMELVKNKVLNEENKNKINQNLLKINDLNNNKDLIKIELEKETELINSMILK